MNEGTPLPTELIPSNTHTADFEGRTIDVFKLIHLTEAVASKSVPTTAFEGAKLNKYWHDSHGNWLGPQDIIDACKNTVAPHKLVDDESLDSGLREHIKRVLDADFVTYPIITVKGTVVDGIHRLTKAFIEGVENIEVKDFEELPSGVVVD